MAADQRIPVYTTLQEVYNNLGDTINHSARWANLAEEFQKRFGKKPTYIARAPGRVNLIGEHIDYALFGVFPAAIERDILIACAPRDLPHPDERVEDHHAPGSVIADNLHDKFTKQVFKPASTGVVPDPTEEEVHAEGWHLDINTKKLKWESYVKAGYYGVLTKYFTPTSQSTGHPVPVDLLVTGSVPAGSGLSSSAAMVVASTLAFLAVNEKLSDPTLTKGKLVTIAMDNEKRVGVNSGGMDQAASVISLPSSALYISFYPHLSADPIPLPQGAVFVCANSLVVADKVVGAGTRYNLRVVETLVGARVLARELGVSIGPGEKVTYREVLGRWVEEDLGGGEGDGMDVKALKDALEKVVPRLECLKPPGHMPGSGAEEEGVLMKQMIQMSGMEEAEFNQVYLSWVDVEASHFQLYKRGMHVVTEALRVLQFREICTSPAGNTNTATPLHALGELMNASQTSCSSLFQCSCPELDQLTQLCREAGAIGSRLTGAGWGGCTVSLVSETQVDSFIAKIKESYPPYRGLTEEAFEEAVFATKPSSGACVYKVE